MLHHVVLKLVHLISVLCIFVMLICALYIVCWVFVNLFNDFNIECEI